MGFREMIGGFFGGKTPEETKDTNGDPAPAGEIEQVSGPEVTIPGAETQITPESTLDVVPGPETTAPAGPEFSIPTANEIPAGAPIPPAKEIPAGIPIPPASEIPAAAPIPPAEPIPAATETKSEPPTTPENPNQAI